MTVGERIETLQKIAVALGGSLDELLEFSLTAKGFPNKIGATKTIKLAYVYDRPNNKAEKYVVADDGTLTPFDVYKKNRLKKDDD